MSRCGAERVPRCNGLRGSGLAAAGLAAAGFAAAGFAARCAFLLLLSLSLSLSFLPSVLAGPAAPVDFEADLAARRLYREAVDLSASRPGRGKKIFAEIAAKYPGTKWAKKAARWLEENPITQVVEVFGDGPPKNRIDVAVMGDGFKDNYTDRKMFGRLADDLLRNFFRSAVFAEYASYFSFYEVMLASRDNRVDYRDHRYDTALDGRKLSDDRHIVVDRGRVRHYLEALEWSDGLAFAIVREGGLGTGGGGVATVGKDMGPVVIHEFGHAFAGLADEYSREASPRGTPVRGPNVSTSPDPRKAPWAHWFKKYPTKFKAHEGGAGVYKGVWRPTPDGCVMRAGNDYCAVCREAIVLRIYSFVKPIDAVSPEPGTRVDVTAGGDKTFLEIFPLVPKSHRLRVQWSVIPEGDPDFERIFPERGTSAIPGDVIAGKRNTVRKRPHHFVEIQDLLARRKIGVGRYRIFARVSDPCKVKGDPWVLKDSKGLLSQTVSWIVKVEPAPPPPPPAVDLAAVMIPLFSHGRFAGFDCTAAVVNRPGKELRFGPFEDLLGCGVVLGLPEGAGARDAKGNPLEVRTFGSGGIEAASAGTPRFTVHFKRTAAAGAGGSTGQGRGEESSAASGGGAAVPGPGRLPPPIIVDTGSLFLAPRGFRPGRIDVAFTLPRDWALAAPWARLRENTYRAPSPRSLGRNIICLGAFDVNEAQAVHVLLRTAISSRLQEGGKELKTLFFRMLAAAGGCFPFPAGRILLVAADRGEGESPRVVRGEDSLLFLLPRDYDPAHPGEEAESGLLELAARQFLAFFGPRPADGGAASFLGSAHRLIALRAVAASPYRFEDWFNQRAVRYLALGSERKTGPAAGERAGRGAAEGNFAAGFFLDLALDRLAGKRLAPFIAGLPGTGASLTIDDLLARLSAYAGFDARPLWKRLTKKHGGPDVAVELEKCGLDIVTGKDGVPRLSPSAKR